MDVDLGGEKCFVQGFLLLEWNFSDMGEAF